MNPANARRAAWSLGLAVTPAWPLHRRLRMDSAPWKETVGGRGGSFHHLSTRAAS